jgi:hypothetical protein
MHATGGKAAPQAALNLSGIRHGAYREKKWKLGSHPHTEKALYGLLNAFLQVQGSRAGSPRWATVARDETLQSLYRQA